MSKESEDGAGCLFLIALIACGVGAGCLWGAGIGLLTFGGLLLLIVVASVTA